MDRQLILSSHSVRNKNGNKPSDFIIKYINPIILDPNRQYEIGLDRIISMSFTWFNLTKELNNQKIRYSSDSGANWTEIIFNPGVWNYIDFDNLIKEKTKTGTSSNPQYPSNHSGVQRYCIQDNNNTSLKLQIRSYSK